MAPQQPIVITGFGLITSLGANPEAVFEAALAGRCGIGPMPALEQTPSPDKGGGQAVDLPPDADPDGPRVVRYLRHAARQALQQAGQLPYPPVRISACLGTTLHGMPAGGRFLRSGDAHDLADFLSGAVLGQALRGLGIHGASMTNCSACASGLASIGLAATLLNGDAADAVLAGGYDCVSEYVYAGFDSLRLIAPGPPLPFAAARDGMKVAEGYAVLVMEREQDALARGARVLARIAGTGESSDAFHLTQPQPDGAGAARAIRAALDNAGLTPADVDLVAAHATSTPNNDAAEYAALSLVFGGHLAAVPVTAFKSHLGHTLGAAGAAELILSALCRSRHTVPPVAHRASIDEKFAGLRVVQDHPLQTNVRTTLNLSLGFGGSNAAVVLSDRPALRTTTPRRHKAVITGIGVVVPGGIGNAAFARLMTGNASPMGGGIPEDDLNALVNTRRARRISGYSRLTLAATSAACDDAGISGNPDFLSSCSAMLGSTHGASPYCEEYYTQIVREGIGAANPVLFAEGVPNAAAAQMSLMLGLKGPCQTLIGTRTAGLDALRMAALRISLGETERVLVSAAEEHSAGVDRAYEPCGLTDDAPHHLWLTGSAAVTLVVESEESARGRQAKVYGHIADSSAAAEGDPIKSVASLCRLLLTDIPLVLSALSDVRPDRAAAASLARCGLRHWTVHPRLPELFSAGPLAALAAWLLGLGPEASAAAVLASDFAGSATAVRIARSPVS